MTIRLLILFVLFTLNSLAQTSSVAPRFLQLRPAVSTREDVDRLFGKSDPAQHSVMYKTPDFVIQVEYSQERCDVNGVAEWGLPVGELEEIYFVPRDERPLRLKDVIFDRAQFKRHQISDEYCAC